MCSECTREQNLVEEDGKLKCPFHTKEGKLQSEADFRRAKATVGMLGAMVGAMMPPR